MPEMESAGDTFSSAPLPEPSQVTGPEAVTEAEKDLAEGERLSRKKRQTTAWRGQ